MKASENRKKGAKHPADYVPPNEAFHCEYAAVWTRIKERFELETTPRERAALEQLRETCP